MCIRGRAVELRLDAMLWGAVKNDSLGRGGVRRISSHRGFGYFHGSEGSSPHADKNLEIGVHRRQVFRSSGSKAAGFICGASLVWAGTENGAVDAGEEEQ